MGMALFRRKLPVQITRERRVTEADGSTRWVKENLGEYKIFPKARNTVAWNAVHGGIFGRESEAARIIHDYPSKMARQIERGINEIVGDEVQLRHMVKT